MDYAFTVEKITQSFGRLLCVMDIHSMRELFGEAKTTTMSYFPAMNWILIRGGCMLPFSRKTSQTARIYCVSMMMPMIYMLTGISGLIFCVVMYLMMKVMIDRSAFSISLIKVFGYRTGEIRRLYLNGNFYIIAVSAAVCLPLSKKLMDMISRCCFQCELCYESVIQPAAILGNLCLSDGTVFCY